MKVDTIVLADQASGLQLLALRAAGIQETILHISDALLPESIGKSFLPALKQAASEVEDCSGDLRRLGTALLQIGDAYTAVEGRILEEAEFAAVHAAWMEPQVIRLPEIWMQEIEASAEAAEHSSASITGAIDWLPWNPDAET